MSHQVIHPDSWLPSKGFSNGILASDGTLYIAGQIGWNRRKKMVCGDFIAQMEQALRNIVAITEAAGGKVTDIVRLTWFVTDKSVYLARQKEVGKSYRRIMGTHFPAMSLLVVAELVEDDALVEIEATARILACAEAPAG